MAQGGSAGGFAQDYACRSLLGPSSGCVGVTAQASPDCCPDSVGAHVVREDWLRAEGVVTPLFVRHVELNSYLRMLKETHGVTGKEH